MTKLARMFLGLAAVALLTVPAAGQDDPFQRKWFWGAQAGVSIQSTTGGRITAYTVGGNWLITGTRSALYLAYDQELYPNTTANVSGFQVALSNGRRINASLLAFPKKGFFFGGGFTIHQITDATLTGNNVFGSQAEADAAQLTVNDAASSAYFTFTAGLQMPIGSKALLYANYQYLPSASDYIITSDIHVINGGLRIALGSAYEDISTDRR